MHGRRLISFSLIGFGVFVLGIFFQAFLVRALRVPTVPAYVTREGSVLAFLLAVQHKASSRNTA